MQLYKGTGCQISLIGYLKSLPKYDDKTHSFFIVLERKKPYFDTTRQFLQEDITWFRVLLSNSDAHHVTQHVHIGTLITVSGDLATQTLSKPSDYTAAMTEIIAEKIEWIPPTPTEKFSQAMGYLSRTSEYCFLH